MISTDKSDIIILKGDKTKAAIPTPDVRLSTLNFTIFENKPVIKLSSIESRTEQAMKSSNRKLSTPEKIDLTIDLRKSDTRLQEELRKLQEQLEAQCARTQEKDEKIKELLITIENQGRLIMQQQSIITNLNTN